MNKYDKENYVHLEDYWKQYLPIVLFGQYEKYFHGNVADFGCNTGLFDFHVSNLENVNEIIGFDVNESAINQAKIFMNEKNNNKTKFICCDISKKCEYENYFDFAISFHTLEHIFPEDIENTINNINKSLKINSYILINIPDKYSYDWEPLHVYKPEMKELNELFEKNGFSTIESYIDERGGQIGKSKNITALYRKIHENNRTFTL